MSFTSWLNFKFEKKNENDRTRTLFLKCRTLQKENMKNIFYIKPDHCIFCDLNAAEYKA